MIESRRVVCGAMWAVLVGCSSDATNGVSPASRAGEGGSVNAGAGGTKAEADPGGASSAGRSGPVSSAGQSGRDSVDPSGGAAPITKPSMPPTSDPGAYRGVAPQAGTPFSIGNTRIFDDLSGLVWNPSNQELLFVVGQDNKIMRFRSGLPDAQNFDVLRPGGEHMDEMKGLDLGPDGALWVCEARATAAHRVSRSTDGYDHPVTVVDHFQGSATAPASDFTSPWYVSVRWDGNVYFTDTPHAYSGVPNKSLFRIDPRGALTMLKHYGSDADLSEAGPFGIALSPTHGALYIDTWNHPGYPQLVRFDLDADGAIAKETLLMTDPDGPIQSVDGLCIDQGENIYMCTGGGGVRMYGATGTFLGSIDVPGATDCSFGGTDMKTLFVATSGSVAGDKNLYQVAMNIPGLP